MIDHIDHSNDKPIKMKPWELAVASLLFGLILIGVACEIDKEESKKAEVKVEKPVLYVEQAFDALLRKYRIDKVCFDQPNNAYFVHIDPKQFDEDEGEAEEYWRGWHHTPSPNFYYLEASNTWYLDENEDMKKRRVYINDENLLNLQCATKTP